MKVLVVDDSATMRKIAAQMVKKLGYNPVVEAGDGREALQVLEQNADVGLVLTDWNMPNMNGLELVQAIRADDAMSELPIIMVTTRNMKSDIMGAMKAGVNNYLTKPFDPPTMKEKIDRVLK
jgi:two-component system chemotaxis response regulator CheY